MPAPVWTWIDTVGPPAVPFATANYYAKVQVDLSSYVGYGTCAGVTTRNPRRLILIDTVGYQPDAISTGSGQNITTPDWKSTVALGSTLTLRVDKHYYVPGGANNYYTLNFTGIDFIGFPGPTCQTFCMEIPAAIRLKLNDWFGDTTKTPTHVVVTISSLGDPTPSWAWFDQTGYDSSVAYLNPLCRTTASPNPLSTTDKLYNGGTIDAPNCFLYQYPDAGASPSLQYFGPVLLSDGSVVYADDYGDRIGQFAPLAFGKAVTCYGYEVASGVNLAAVIAAIGNPSAIITYLDITGNIVGTETFTGSWVSLGVSGGFEYFQAAEQTFTLTPPSAAIMWAPEFVGMDYFPAYFDISRISLQTHGLQCLDGSGSYLPGILCKAIP